MNLGNIITTLLSYLLPIDDPNIRFQIAMAIGQPIGVAIEYFNKTILNANLWRSFYKYNSISIGSDHPMFSRLMNYYYINFGESIKGIDLVHNGKFKIMIELLKTRTICDGDIEIKLQHESWKTIPDLKNENVHHGSQKLIFMSYKSVQTINKYIESVVKKASQNEESTIEIYHVEVHNSEKSRNVEWKRTTMSSNRTMFNTIVSEEVQKNYFDDLERFNNASEEYKRKGIGYTRGYCLFGKPGSGKSALWESVANDKGWNVFKIDMSVVHNNSEVYKLVNTIYDWITPNERHILLLEDFDRSELFKRWGGNTAVTMDCILDVLDARGANGRVTFLTANEMEKIKNNDAFDAMFRPGRIDRMIEINYCSIDQINRILNLYFDNDDDLELNSEIKVTVAELNKIIQLKQELKNVLSFLNKFITFESGGHIEELCKIDIDDIEVEEIDMEEINKKVQTKKLKDIRKPKSTKIYGEMTLNKLKKWVADGEFELENMKDKNAVDYQLKYWTLEKKKLTLKEKQKLFLERKLKKEILDKKDEEKDDNDNEDKKDDKEEKDDDDEDKEDKIQEDNHIKLD